MRYNRNRQKLTQLHYSDIFNLQKFIEKQYRNQKNEKTDQKSLQIYFVRFFDDLKIVKISH